MSEYQLRVITREKTIFDGAITSLVAPATDGYLGVWAHHAPLAALLGEGRLTFDVEGVMRYFAIRCGVLEVNHNVATVLIDEMADDGAGLQGNGDAHA